MLREDGFVMDDGTTARLTEDSYVMSTTTAHAGQVMQHLEFSHQAMWPDLDVSLVSVTEQCTQYAVPGHRSPELLQHLIGSRPEDRHVGPEYVRTGYSRWSPQHSK